LTALGYSPDSAEGLDGRAARRRLRDLDNLSTIEEIDSHGFLRSVEAFPAQIEQAWSVGKEARSLPDWGEISSIAVLGVGGSGISGNVLKAVLGPTFPLFVHTCKGYELPGWVGPNTLVLAVSYSGETEEILETVEKAQWRNSHIVTVSSGGTLNQLGERLGYPTSLLPVGLQPRAALGYLSMALLAVCQNLGWADFEADVAETVDLLSDRASGYARQSPTVTNPAKQLAHRLVGTLPLIYGSEGLAEVAAYRWKCQLNECSKVAAYHHLFPELNHNEISAWTEKGYGSCNPAVVVLRHPHEHARISKRISVTTSLISEQGAVLEEVCAKGTSKLASLMDLICLGDFVATYLALLRGIDPGQVEMIDEVKRRMSDARVTSDIVR
jgi:glucose/mannose-6-phosphate isomerase